MQLNCLVTSTLRSQSIRIASVFTVVSGVYAQNSRSTPPEDNTFMYSVIGVILLGVGLAVLLKMRGASVSRQKGDVVVGPVNSQQSDPVDADKELEWLRRNKDVIDKRRIRRPRVDQKPDANEEEVFEDIETVREKIRQVKFSILPVSSFSRLRASKLFDPLPLGSDQGLLTAIEQSQEEFEDDIEIRDLSLRVLAAFRTRNSVDAVKDIALYDLSSTLRSKAANVLADFNHESCFEILLLACADPAREVRAAAARGLFRMNCDRTDAWLRIIESNDQYRITQAARAAREAGLIKLTFERLVHDDMKIAYEAFAFVCLLIRAGETEEVIQTIAVHHDENVRRALIHAIRVNPDDRVIAKLISERHNPELDPETRELVEELVQDLIGVAV